MILLIDNYDSFTYNLYQALSLLDPDVRVVRNDLITIEEIEAMKVDGIVLSPGPGAPVDAGICIELIKKLGHKVPIFGCLPRTSGDRSRLWRHGEKGRSYCPWKRQSDFSL